MLLNREMRLRPTLVSMIRDICKSKTTNCAFCEHLRQDATEELFKVTLSASRTRPLAGVVVVLHDMTKEKEVAEMKNDFVSNVSHELHAACFRSKHTSRC